MAEEFESLSLDSVECANKIRFIAAKDFGLNLNMTQTQKLLYIAYGIELARAKTRLTKEHPKAWPFGPVFPNVHRHLDFLEVPKNPSAKFSEEILTLFKEVIAAFGKTPASKLSEWSHAKGSPWDKAPKPPETKWCGEISDDDIFEYFSGLKCAKSGK